MIKLKFLALCLVSATLLFNGCSSSDDDFPDPVDPSPLFRTTKTMVGRNGMYTLGDQFVYDTTGVLLSAFTKRTLTDGDVLMDEFVYEHNSDGKIAKVTRKTKYWGENGEELSKPDVVFTPKYSGDNIAEISYREDGKDNTVFYTWQNGRVVTVKLNDVVKNEFKYIKGNYWGFEEKTSTKTVGGLVYTTKEELTIGYDTVVNMYKKLIPAEFTFFVMLDKIEGYHLSDNNMMAMASTLEKTVAEEGSGDVLKSLFFTEELRKVDLFFDDKGIINRYLTHGEVSWETIDYLTGEEDSGRTGNSIDVLLTTLEY